MCFSPMPPLIKPPKNDTLLVGSESLLYNLVGQ